MQARGMWSAGQGDDKERFLADLRALRDTVALEFDELAARAHYPGDILKEAESGPSLPSLPILAAYVRACDGDVPEWEERWRRLGFEAGADPGLPVRPAGASPAAVAGARAGVSVVPPDAYDPDRIRAALRGSHVRADQGAPANAGQQTASPARGDQRSAVASSDAEPRWDAGSRWDARPSWDTTAHQGSTPTNGNHHAGPREDAADGAFTETPNAAATADALRRDPFSSSWLDDSQPIPAVPDTKTGRAGTEDAEQEPPGWTGFWTPVKAAAAPADVQRPSAPPPADEPAGAETSWSVFTPSSSKITAEPVRRTDPDPAPRAEPAVARGAANDPTVELPPPPAPPAPTSSAAPARPQAPARPAIPQPAPAPPSESRPDRYYPLRLLAVIVVAALIGSVLVMILR